MTGHDGSGAEGRPGSLAALCRRLAPHLEIVSVSQPEPQLADTNVIGLCPDVETARQAVISLERVASDDSRLGLVVMSEPGETSTRTDRTDPEGVTGKVAKRAVVGGLAGAAIGAALFGIVGGIVGGDWASAIGASIGGVALLGAFGAIWTVFAGLGGSDAYRQTYVDPDIDALGIVMVPGGGGTSLDDARRHLESIDGVKVLDVDGRGEIRGAPAAARRRRA